MHRLHASPVSVITDKRNREQALRRINDEKVLLSIIKDIAQNFENIYSINENTDIFCLGIYTPLFIQRLMKIFPKMEKFEQIINLFNSELSKLCSRYNVRFVDNSYLTKYCAMMGLDFHSVQQGHYLMAMKMVGEVYDKLIQNQSDITKYKGQFEIDNKGLLGMVEDANGDYLRMACKLTSKGNDNFNEWISKAKEYRSEYDLFTDAYLQVKSYNKIK